MPVMQKLSKLAHTAKRQLVAAKREMADSQEVKAGIEDVNGTKAYFNPSADAVHNLMAQHNVLRGIIHQDGIHVWPGHDATHYDIANGLGLRTRTKIHSPHTIFHMIDPSKADPNDPDDGSEWQAGAEAHGNVRLNAANVGKINDATAKRHVRDHPAIKPLLDASRAAARPLPAEAKIENYYGVDIHHNPPPSHLQGLLNKHKSVRGIMHGKDLHVWAAHDAIHHGVARCLGLNLSHPDTRPFQLLDKSKLDLSNPADRIALADHSFPIKSHGQLRVSVPDVHRKAVEGHPTIKAALKAAKSAETVPVTAEDTWMEAAVAHAAGQLLANEDRRILDEVAAEITAKIEPFSSSGNLHANPSLDELHGALKKHGVMRGLVHGENHENLHVWPGDSAIHAHVASLLKRKGGYKIGKDPRSLFLWDKTSPRYREYKDDFDFPWCNDRDTTTGAKYGNNRGISDIGWNEESEGASPIPMQKASKHPTIRRFVDALKPAKTAVTARTEDRRILDEVAAEITAKTYPLTPAGQAATPADAVTAALTAGQRAALPDSDFCVIKTVDGKRQRGYPIHDIKHARNALARVAQNGDARTQKRVKAMVYRRYPELKRPAKTEAKDYKLSPAGATGTPDFIGNAWIDVELLIYLFEVAREKLKSDIEVHEMVERIEHCQIDKQTVLTMDDVKQIVLAKYLD